MLKLLLVAISFLLVSIAVKAEVYVWRDAHGILNYSDRLPEEGARDVRVLRIPKGATNRAGSGQPGAATAGGAGSWRSAPSEVSTAVGGAPYSGGAGAAGGGGGGRASAGGGAGGAGGGGGAGGAGGGGGSVSGGGALAGGGTAASGGGTTASGGTIAARVGTSTSGGTTTAGVDTSTSGGTTTVGGSTSTSGGTTTAGGGTSSNCANPSGGYEGFGRNTTGGAGQPVYRVTNLNDSGVGSLRDAIAAGNRCVVFDVGGTISLASMLSVRGANVTIDGFTAPSPGITLRNYDLVMHASRGANNVVVRGIRSRDANLLTRSNSADGIAIIGVSNIVIDHVSVAGFGDGAIDVTDDAHDVTIQWSILAEGNPSHNFVSLIKYDTSRVSVHHNLFVNGKDRNPMCGRSDVATALGSEVICDIRNNLIWNYSQWGTTVRQYGTANVVNNYYYSSTRTSNPADALLLREGSVAYASGNYSQNGLNVDSQGNRSTPFAAIVPTTTDAITAAHQIVAQAGARGPNFGLDALDQNRLGQILLTR